MTADVSDHSFDSLSDQDNSEVRQSMAGAAAALFSRQDDMQASLADFEIKKMIGKGTFGKVFLVQHTTN